jgi:hypothetical protein
MSHQYEVGDQISLAFGFYDHAGAGVFAIVRRLPAAMSGEPQYVVQGGDDRQRVIGEAQVAPASAASAVRWPVRRPHNPITEALNKIAADMGNAGSKP